MRWRYFKQRLASRLHPKTSASRSTFSRLSPEILLPIFLNLTSQEIVLFRRTCRKWLEVIETNKLLWRNLEWLGRDQESIEKAVEMFDEKSASSLETVSIEEDRERPFQDLQEQVRVISQSSDSLKSIFIQAFLPSAIARQLLVLSIVSPKLDKLVLWGARMILPATHLLQRIGNPDEASSTGRLKVLWLYGVSDELLGLPTQQVSSLVSFAYLYSRPHQQIVPFIAKFSESIVHLSLGFTFSGSPMEQTLSCPNLRILEARFKESVSSFFNCPQLQILIRGLTSRSKFNDIPSSVEELWLRNREEFSARDWEALLSSCPKMRVLKLDEDFISGDGSYGTLSPEDLIKVLETRQKMVNSGVEIQGLKLAPLQELVFPLGFFSEEQLKRSRKVSKGVIDVEDYPKFIELEY